MAPSVQDDDGDHLESVPSENLIFIKSEERGLSDLVRQCLGKPLNKEQQMSDWEKRPLRPQQIKYAGKLTIHEYF